MTLTLLAFLVLIAIGTPIVLALGVSAAMAIVSADIPVGIIAQRMYGGLDSFTVMAIPFFVLTGIIMERGGIAQAALSTFRWHWSAGSRAAYCWLPPSPAVGMAAVSGSGAASTAAISSVMLEGNAPNATTTSIFPPASWPRPARWGQSFRPVS